MKLPPIVRGQSVTIAVPTRNRHAYLAALLTSLLTQTYTHWNLVINDSSDEPVEGNPAIQDLLRLIEATGHQTTVIHTSSGWDRHQRAMEAAPPDADLILRIDDDLVMTPTFAERLVDAMSLPLTRPTAAVGGCYPEPRMKPVDLNQALTDPEWAPRLVEPAWRHRGWRLQGHHYRQRHVIEVDHLLGHAICYRRRLAEQAGGWAVPGYSSHAYREESDLCARLVAAGYGLAVTTAALAYHLMSPSGGSRDITKGPAGNVLVSDRRPLDADDELFSSRLQAWRESSREFDRPLNRFDLEELERGVTRPLQTRFVDHLMPLLRKILQPVRTRLRPVRRALRNARRPWDHRPV